MINHLYIQHKEKTAETDTTVSGCVIIANPNPDTHFRSGVVNFGSYF